MGPYPTRPPPSVSPITYVRPPIPDYRVSDVEMGPFPRECVPSFSPPVRVRDLSSRLTHAPRYSLRSPSSCPGSLRRRTLFSSLPCYSAHPHSSRTPSLPPGGPVSPESLHGPQTCRYVETSFTHLPHLPFAPPNTRVVYDKHNQRSTTGLFTGVCPPNLSSRVSEGRDLGPPVLTKEGSDVPSETRSERGRRPPSAGRSHGESHTFVVGWRRT